MTGTFFERWTLDRRFFYVWFSSQHEAHREFGSTSSGAHLAVCDDFGTLVPTSH